MEAAVGPVLQLSPSFSSYSHPSRAFNSGEFHRGFCLEERREKDSGDCDDGDDFDFSFVTIEPGPSSPIPADEVFQNGTIRPGYPVFRRDLLLGQSHSTNEIIRHGDLSSGSDQARPRVRHPLRDLFMQERGTTTQTTTSNFSSSEPDKPPPPPPATVRNNRSISAGGNCKRWRFKVKGHNK